MDYVYYESLTFTEYDEGKCRCKAIAEYEKKERRAGCGFEAD